LVSSFQVREWVKVPDEFKLLLIPFSLICTGHAELVSASSTDPKTIAVCRFPPKAVTSSDDKWPQVVLTDVRFFMIWEKGRLVKSRKVWLRRIVEIADF